MERRDPGPYGVFTLHDVPFQGTSARRATEGPSPDYNSRRRRRRDFQAGLFPVRSPLLGKSWLVSSPPLSDMLKLSGWSFPIRGLMRDLTQLSPGASRDLEKFPRYFSQRVPARAGTWKKFGPALELARTWGDLQPRTLTNTM